MALSSGKGFQGRSSSCPSALSGSLQEGLHQSAASSTLAVSCNWVCSTLWSTMFKAAERPRSLSAEMRCQSMGTKQSSLSTSRPVFLLGPCNRWNSTGINLSQEQFWGHEECRITLILSENQFGIGTQRSKSVCLIIFDSIRTLLCIFEGIGNGSCVLGYRKEAVNV